MSKRHRGAFGMIVGLLASLATAPMASAGVWSNHSGTICRNTIAGQAQFFGYGSSGVTNSDPNYSYTKPVTCPLVRRTISSNGAKIYVDVYHVDRQTTTCLAYSYGASGTLASTYTGWTGSGVGSMLLNLTGAGKSNFASDYSVVCHIAGGYKARVSGVHLDEQ